MNETINKACVLVSDASNIEIGSLSINSKNTEFSEWDSFTIIKIALELEKSFGISVDDIALEKLTSIEGIVSLITPNTD